MDKLYKNYKHPFLPQNYIAEEILIGILLIYPETFLFIMSNVQKEYFFLESHQLIFVTLKNLYKSKQLNILELLYKLQENKILWKIGGIKKIINIMKQSQIFISSSKINHFHCTKELIKLISANYYKRLLIQYGHNIIKLGYISKIKNISLERKISHYLNSINSIHFSMYTETNNITSFKDLVTKQITEIQQNKKIKTQDIIKSGFYELDKITCGLPNGDLIIIAGRPSTGKTSLAINIAYNIFSNKQGNISIFSLEMSSKQILNKFISIASKIPTNKINQLSHKQWLDITKLCKELLYNNIYINQQNHLNFDQIEKTAKDIKKKIKT